MVRKFVGRQKKIAVLEDEWNKTNGKLIILYGRRRIGKTRLITEFISDKNGIFYFAQDTSPQRKKGIWLLILMIFVCCLMKRIIICEAIEEWLMHTGIRDL